MYTYVQYMHIYTTCMSHISHIEENALTYMTNVPYYVNI